MVGSKPQSAGKFGELVKHERGRAGDVTGTYYCDRCGELVDITRNAHEWCGRDRR